MASRSRAAQRMREAGLTRSWRPPEGFAENDRGVMPANDGRPALNGEENGGAVEARSEATGTVVPALGIIDVTGHLPPEAPAQVVRDSRGRVHVDFPNADRASGRSWNGVDKIVSLPHLGGPLLVVLLDQQQGAAPKTWIKHISALCACCRAIAATRYADTPVVDLPRDFVDHVGAASAKLAGGALLFNGRENINRLRILLSKVPGTEHLDLERRKNEQDVAGQWRMSGGEVVATPRHAFTDADVEKLVKRCSLELRETIARRNQLVSFMGGTLEAEGPSSRELLRAAQLLLERNEALPTYWKGWLDRGSPEYALFFRVGWDAALRSANDLECEWRVRTPAHIEQLRTNRELLLRAGGTRDDLLTGHLSRSDGFVRLGWKEAVRVAYPTARDMRAPAVLMGLLTRFNSTLLATVAVDALRPRDVHWTEIEDGRHEERVRAAPFKPRSRRLQPIDFPVTEEPEDPVPLARFVQDWTSHIRGADARIDGHLFLFVSDEAGPQVKGVSFGCSDQNHFRAELRLLSARAGCVDLTPRTLRTIGIDMIHARTGGDPMLVHASGNWAIGSNMPALYLGGPAQARERERLYWAGRILERQREHGIVVDQRPRGADLFAVEDGFRCANPLDPPDPLPPGELCRSKGMCAICPHGRLDLASPIWSFARLAARAAYIHAAIQARPSDEWRRRYQPVLAELIDIWLPMFPEDVIDAARSHPAYAILELSDV